MAASAAMSGTGAAGMTEAAVLHGVFALELAGGGIPGRAALAPGQGGELAMATVLCGLILLVMAGWLWRDASVRIWEKVLAVLVLAIALIAPCSEPGERIAGRDGATKQSTVNVSVFIRQRRCEGDWVVGVE